MTGTSQSHYSHRVRVRICGILVHDGSLLMVKHKLGPAGELWIPPGGELEFGESMEQALKREFLEETSLQVVVGPFAFVYEFVNEPLHAIELFYHIKSWSGSVNTGNDPEYEEQLIVETRFVTFDEISIMDKRVLHGIFNYLEKPEEITGLSGVFRAQTRNN